MITHKSVEQTNPLFSRRKDSENDLKNSKQLVFSKTVLISSYEK